jgi:predicted acetyltransferase
LYTGYYKNKPICTGLIYIEGGVAGLYWISTVPDYRKKGFGLSLTSHILEQIKKRGIKTAVLNSSKAGSNLYRKMGFEELAKVYLYSLED